MQTWSGGCVGGGGGGGGGGRLTSPPPPPRQWHQNTFSAHLASNQSWSIRSSLVSGRPSASRARASSSAAAWVGGIGYTLRRRSLAFRCSLCAILSRSRSPAGKKKKSSHHCPTNNVLFTNFWLSSDAEILKRTWVHQCDNTSIYCKYMHAYSDGIYFLY